MGIAVLVILPAEQGTLLGQDADHLLVPLEDILPDKRGHAAFLGELAVIIDRRENLQADLATKLVVVVTMTGGDVDATAAGLKRHELGRVHRGTAAKEGMMCLEPLKGCTLAGFPMLRELQSGRFLELVSQAGRNDQTLASVLQHDVVEVRMEGDREIGGERPRGGGPDHDAQRHVRGEAHAIRFGGIHRKLHEDRGGGLLLILDLGLGQCGLGSGAPEDRLLAPVDETLLHHASEGSDDRRLVRGVECQVGMLPVAEDPEPAELPALDVDELAGVFLGLLADLQRGESRGGLHHAELDRQTMAVPPRNEGGLKSGHRLRFDDEILEHLVESGPHVDIAVRKGRSVVQDELRRPLAGFLDRGVEPLLLPLGQQLRLTLGQTGLHREVGLGKADGILVAGHGGDRRGLD